MLNMLKEIRAAGNKPRVHGNGFVQLDMLDGRRLHLFGDPDIPAQTVNTAVHDHRFSFRSDILRGMLRNQMISTYESLNPSHMVYTPQARHGEDTELVPTGETVRMWVAEDRTFGAGHHYMFPFGVFHESTADQPTLTVITKTHTEEAHKVRVLVLLGEKPDNDFDRYQHDEAVLWRALERAAEPVRLTIVGA